MLDHKYKIFCSLARHLNMTRAADELHLSQSAVSKSVRELEKELGITLFHRSKGQMQLTEAARYLHEETEKLLGKEREIAFGMDCLRKRFGGTLHIGASTTLAQYILPAALARFIEIMPGIKINLISGNTRQVEGQIRNGELHLAFIEGNPSQPDIHYIPFLKDEIVPVCAAGSNIPASIGKEELGRYPFVFREKGSGTEQVIRKQLAEANIPIDELKEQLVLGSTEGIKQYLCHAECIAFLSIYSIREALKDGHLRIIDIEGLSIGRTLYAIHQQGEPDPYARKFLDFVYNDKSLRNMLYNPIR